MTKNSASSHQSHLEQLAVFIQESEQILADWDAYSDQHTGLDGWPHDENAYGLRAGLRDAATWRAFNRIRRSAKGLVAAAEVQLHKLPASRIQSRWAWQLGALDTALGQLARLQWDWLAAQDSLPPSAVPGTEAYDDALAERNAEAWHYLNEWSLHGQALLDIHAAEQDHPPRAPAPAAPSHTPAAHLSSAKATGPRR
ncbi:hypothetical protein [Streptomyces albireticuli]|uniref:Uncharacterized protein n=1 Tax=Streptomyces albireticuli TaxID=1940 RepID=A0A2A2D7T6_9ACTN|nr:hypothetical protein [Streptomyces albireticuli]MCD9193425.1 hypothetical protein [Streptomyces albireticuli]PAU47507.1 hypothetical protein CK936_18355 [Streptomyces albireticuli]